MSDREWAYKAWEALEALPNYSEEKHREAWAYMPSRLPYGSDGNSHWLTTTLLQWWDAETVKAAFEPLGLWNQKAAERVGKVDWFTPRKGQVIVWEGAAGGGKRQWVIAAPEGLVKPYEVQRGFDAPKPVNDGARIRVMDNKVIVTGVKYRLLFHRGGHRDYRRAYVIDGEGTDTLTIDIR